MHSAALAWVQRCVPEAPGDVLDVGGRDINGSPKPLFWAADTYVTVDLVQAPGVDIAGDICDMGFVAFADTVLCLEVLEHAENWAEIVASCAAALRPRGTLIVTCAGPGRAEHSAADGGPLRPGEWYRNVSTGELFDVMAGCGLEVGVDRLGEDTRAVGRKP